MRRPRGFYGIDLGAFDLREWSSVSFVPPWFVEEAERALCLCVL